MCTRFVTVDVQVVMVMFVVVIGQQAPELVMDIVVVALVETAVLRRQLWSSLPEGGDRGIGVKVVLLPSLAEEGGGHRHGWLVWLAAIVQGGSWLLEFTVEGAAVVVIAIVSRRWSLSLPSGAVIVWSLELFVVSCHCCHYSR